jgi:hypothetical protein
MDETPTIPVTHECTPDHACEHHAHGLNCHLHHPHGDHCDHHGPVTERDPIGANRR